MHGRVLERKEKNANHCFVFGNSNQVLFFGKLKSRLGLGTVFWKEVLRPRSLSLSNKTQCDLVTNYISSKINIT
jgi:hypothetical protein